MKRRWNVMWKLLFLAVLVYAQGRQFQVTTTYAAESYVEQGKDGSISYTLDKEGTLRIRGKGSITYQFQRLRHSRDIQNVEIRSGITAIGERAFANCRSMQSIYIPTTVKQIGASAFHTCVSLSQITIPRGVKELPQDCFNACETLTTVQLSSDVDTIEKSAFARCYRLEKLKLPEDLKQIGSYAFYQCSSLKKLKLPDSLTAIKRGTFEYCRELSSITIPSSITAIGESSFSACEGLISVTIPGSVKKIGDFAFLGCSKLAVIRIPDSVTTMGNATFFLCNDYMTIYGVRNSYADRYADAHNIAFITTSESLHKHTLIHVAAKAPTCEKSGNIAYYKCSTCGMCFCDANGTKTIKEQDTKRACTGHLAVKDAAVKATCAREGKTSGSHCKFCGKILVAQKRIAKLGHKWSHYETIEAATVLSPKLQQRVCSMCGRVQHREVGQKLKPTIALSAREIVIGKGQKTSVKVSNLAQGDSVKTWISQNTTLVKVNQKGIIYGIKKGTTYVEVVLVSGKKAKIRVNIV